MKINPAAFIAHKRDGGEHSPGDFHWLMDSFLSKEFTDYQMTAWLMAVYLRGLSPTETLAFTEAMLHSGKILENPAGGAPRIDKHSTGGVGDKISLALAPLVASCGAHVPMIAGRGLGHTGGTLDKLESIPGFNVQLSRKQYQRVISQAGAAIIGATRDLAPADRRIYALRDVTATVACRPLIVASILSKKLAEGLDGLVLDVKVGRGAFMKTKREARQLAQDLVEVSGALGTASVARLTNMNFPLGTTIGNALEVREAILLLQNEGPPDTRELTLTLAEEMCLLAEPKLTRKVARQRAEDSLSDGSALERFARIIELQGGDPRIIDRPQLLPRTRRTIVVTSTKSGWVHDVDPLALARIALELGAGRKRATDAIDPAVGLEIHASVGDRINKNDALVTLHVRSHAQLDSNEARLAFRIEQSRSEAPELFLGRTAALGDAPTSAPKKV